MFDTNTMTTEEMVNSKKVNEAKQEAFAQNLEANAKALLDNESKLEKINAQLAALRKTKKQFTDMIEKQRAEINNAMTHEDITKFETASFTFSTRNYKPTTVIDNPDALPEKYIKTVVKKSPDKTAIYSALARGEVINGAHLEPTVKTSIEEK